MKSEDSTDDWEPDFDRELEPKEEYKGLSVVESIEKAREEAFNQD